MQGKFGRVEESLAAGGAGDPHTKPFFFPVVSAATCTDSHLEVNQRSDNCKGSSTNSGTAKHALHLRARSARKRCGTLLPLDFFSNTTPNWPLPLPRLELQLLESTSEGKAVNAASREGEDGEKFKGVKAVITESHVGGDGEEFSVGGIAKAESRARELLRVVEGLPSTGADGGGFTEGKAVTTESRVGELGKAAKAGSHDGENEGKKVVTFPCEGGGLLEVVNAWSHAGDLGKAVNEGSHDREDGGDKVVTFPCEGGGLLKTANAPCAKGGVRLVKGPKKGCPSAGAHSGARKEVSSNEMVGSAITKLWPWGPPPC
ncbi:hypothetical protein Taro_033300 [Colocasia esculenta]|uniref:Uncharacterized protein n=1 Tax=Colocasia esculenta TaxID=4460 RepID=A0A843VNG8_COLES|nr:hypothetical protein [Colocasia esculenta]